MLISYYMHNIIFAAKKCVCEASHLRDGVNQRHMRFCGVGCWRCLRVVRWVGRNMRYFMNDLNLFAINMLKWGLRHANGWITSRCNTMVWCGGVFCALFSKSNTVLQRLIKNRENTIAIAYNRLYRMLIRTNCTLFARAPVLAATVSSMRQHPFCVSGFK